MPPDTPEASTGETAMARVGLGGLAFDVRTAGPPDGEAVVLLHGFPQTSYEWRHQIRALAGAGFRAVAPDQRGYSPGARPPDVADYRLSLLVQDVVALADAAGADRFHVVGHDWGGWVAWAVAVLAPDRVITANPVSVPHPDAFRRVLNDPASAQSQASRYFDVFVQPNSEDAFLADDRALLRSVFAGIEAEAVDEYLRVVGSEAALGAALNWYRANIDDVRQGPDLGPVDVPTMFTWSDGDPAITIEGAQLAGEHVTAPYRFEILEGVGHWIPDLAAEAMSDLLLDHLIRYSER